MKNTATSKSRPSPTSEEERINALAKCLRTVRNDMRKSLAVRLHRALSWLKCASRQLDNPDLRFISLWVAFNACYANGEDVDKNLGERDAFRTFVSKLVKHDANRCIYDLLWQKFSGPVKALIENRYVFQPFWEGQRSLAHGNGDAQWAQRFERHKKNALQYLAHARVTLLLAEVLDRLYVLRNQVMHGGATFESKINRAQVRDGCNMLAMLMPVLVGIMLDAKDEDWGAIHYPVVE